MKRNKLIISAFIATLLAGSAQVMAADQQRTRDQLDLDCNECQSLFDDSATVRDRIRDRDSAPDSVVAQDGIQAENQHRYQNTENAVDSSLQGFGGGNHSADSASSLGDSSNSGFGGGMGAGKGHRR